MSALAKLMLIWGHKVSGSDLNYGSVAVELVEWGADVYLGANLQKIREADLIVYSASIKENDTELSAARSYGKKIIGREHFLKEVSLEYAKLVAVGGTHGKTTVTSMLSEIFFEAELSYTAHIGGYSPRGNLVYRGKDIFLSEACEYNRSFLSLSPDVSVILNAEFDHPDTYKNLGEVYKAFESFGASTRRGGTIVVNADSPVFSIIKCSYKHICTYSLESTATFTATNIIDYANGYYGFQILEKNYPKVDIKLKIPGLYNVQNALAAYATAVTVGVDRSIARRGIENFTGVRGRMELMGNVLGAKVYRDYAHHPTEIASAVATAKRLAGKGELKVVFQPHTMLRTASLMGEFVVALSGESEVYILKEYAARVEQGGCTAYELYSELKKESKCYYYNTAIELYSALANSLSAGDTVLILGAGDVAESYTLLLK